MRTIVDLPQEIHAIATAIARDQGRSLSAVISDLVQKGLAKSAERSSEVPPGTIRAGFPILHLPRTITSDDVLRAGDV